MKNEDGFTISEMLVALALLALIAAYAAGALQVFSNVRRVEAGIDRNAARESAMRSMNVAISGMRPVFNLDDNGKLVLDFKGDEIALSFVAPLDDRLERGGLYRMTLDLDQEARRLMLRYALRRTVVAPVESVAMLDGVQNLRFRYSSDGAEWLEKWETADKLPRLIEVRVDGDQRIVAIPAAE